MFEEWLISTVDLLVQNWAFLALSGVVFYVVSIIFDRRNIPPGPYGLPLVGYIPFLSDNAHRELYDLSEKYGKVFCLKLGLNKVVICNDIKIAQEALAKDAFQDRPHPNIFSLNIDGGLTSWNGPLWKEHRKLTARTLRTLGVGKPAMEQLIGEEIKYLMTKIDEFGGEAVPLQSLLATSASNVVHAILYGKRYDYDHPTRKLLDQVFAFSEKGMPNILFTGYFMNFLVVIQYLLRIPSKLTNLIIENGELFLKYMGQEVAEHIEQFDEANIKDYLDSYIAEYNLKKGSKTFIDLKRLAGISGDLFGAGSSTVKDAVEWLLFYLAIDQNAQKKVHDEIDSKIGLERDPTFADRADMPYTHAMIQETFRLSSSIPINIPHLASEDTTVGDYFIPKGYLLLVNQWAIHRDPAYWKDGDKFQPERFLSQDGKKLVKRESFIPFSYGKRSCPGEILAQVEVFMYAVYILQRYRIEAPKGHHIGQDRVVAFSLVPPQINYQLIRRSAAKSSQ